MSHPASIERWIWLCLLAIILMYARYLTMAGESRLDYVIDRIYPVPPSSMNSSEIEVVDTRMLRRYLVKNLACSYRDRLYALAANETNTFDDLIEFHRDIENLNLEPDQPKPWDDFDWGRYNSMSGIKWDDSMFVLRRWDSQKVRKDFMICLPPKSGTSNWQIAMAKMFRTKEDMIKMGIHLDNDSKNQFYPAALYGLVPRFQSVKHAALLTGTGKRFLNTRDPFTRARSGWRDKIQNYPEDPPHDANNRQFDKYVAAAKLEKGPPAPPKFKVSFEKWLRMLIHTKNLGMNQHWKSQDGNCHICSLDFEFILHGRRSEEEWPWVLTKVGLDGVMELSSRYGGPDMDTGWFMKEAQGFIRIPIDLIKQIYRRYYFDFVSLGYSPDFVKKFIQAVEKVQAI